MKKLIMVLVLMGASLGLVACGDSDSSSGSGSDGGLTGVWSGSTSSSVVNFTSPVRLTITNDDGVNFAGTATVSSSPCFKNATLAGSKNGATVNAGVVNGNNTLGATFTLNGNTLSGGYVVTTGDCVGDQGTISVSRG